MAKSFLERLCPDRYYNSVFDIDLEELKTRNIKGLILDLDNTLVAKREKKIPNGLYGWLESVANQKIGVCVVSNSLAKRAEDIAGRVKLPVVAPAKKPMKKAFENGMRLLGTTQEETAVVGDQLFTDILGGNKADTYTILVAPISKREPLHTKILRKLEKIVLKNLTSKGLFKDGRRVEK